MNKKKILLPIAMLAFAVGGFMALKASRPKQAAVPPTEQVWRVEAITVEPASLSPQLTLYGKVESPELTRAAAPGVARVSRVLVLEGQAVRRGQLLLELDPRDFEPRVVQAQGQVDELMAAMASERMRHAADLDQLEQERRLLEFAAADVARFERLREENFYSQAAVDQSRQALARQTISLRSRELAIKDHQARMAQFQSRLKQAQANLEQARLALLRSRVIAPFDGIVADLQVAEGDQVGNGQVLMALYPSAGLEVRAKIPAPHQDEILDLVGRGRRLEATTRLAGKTLKLELTRLSGAADTRGLDAFFRFTQAHDQLRVGSLLTLHLSRAAVEGAIAVPYAALYGGRQVYKVDSGRIQAVQVKVQGELAGERPMLLISSEALKRGDLVMTTHLPNAVSGLRVEVLKQ
ncbi:MAG: efflux RND transporter periplasmic adaptor subunit [Thiobacillaceae bacterium]